MREAASGSVRIQIDFKTCPRLCSSSPPPPPSSSSSSSSSSIFQVLSF